MHRSAFDFHVKSRFACHVTDAGIGEVTRDRLVQKNILLKRPDTNAGDHGLQFPPG